jgi:hypothetical protein
MKTHLFKLMLLAILLATINYTYAQNTPDAPSDFMATPSIDDYKIVLTWTDNSDDESRFVIRKEWTDDVDHNIEISIPASMNSFTDTAVAPNIPYHYSIWSENDFGISNDESVSATVDREAPPAPENVIASTGPMTSIQINFIDNSNLETGFEIQHSIDPENYGFYGKDLITGTWTDSLITTYINDGPFSVAPDAIYYPPNTTVYIRVRAFILDHGHYIYGSFSPIVSAVTRDVPATPSDFSAGVKLLTDSVNLLWTDNADNEAAFLLARFVGDFNPNSITIFELPADANSFNDTTADAHVAYTYRLVAIDLFEASMYPDEYRYQLLSIPSRYIETVLEPTSAPLHAPIITEAVGSSPQQIQIKFIETNTAPDHGYSITYGTDPDLPSFEEWIDPSDSGSVITYQTNSGYDGNTLLYARIRAVILDNEGNYSQFGPESELISATTLAGWPPSPTDFVAFAEGDNIRLTWTDNSLPDHPLDEAAWSIMRANDGGGNYNLAFTLPANTTTFLDTAVSPYVRYTYRLATVNDFGNSFDVYFASAMVRFELPAPVAKLATFVSSTSFTANWKPVPGADYYRVEVFNVKDSIYHNDYHEAIAYDTSLVVYNTKPSKRYTYVVRAVNNFEESAISNTIFVAPIKGLTLRTVCSDDPASYRRWKVINNNHVPVDVSWYVNNTTQSGMHVATIGESYFVTQTVPGLNRTTITWLNDKLIQYSSEKTSSWRACASDSTARYADLEEDIAEDESLFTVEAYPNEVSDKVKVRISSEANEEVIISIINMQGHHLYNNQVKTNTDIEIDASTYSSGIYLLKVQQTTKSKTIKLLKR